MSEDLGSWLTLAVQTTVERVSSSIGRPLRLNEVHQIVVAIGERIGRECRDREQRATPDEAADAPLICKRKPGLSMTRTAVKSRDCRQRAKDRAARGVARVPVEVAGRHVDALEQQGYYDARQERIDATKAIAAAVEGLLDAMTPSKK